MNCFFDFSAHAVIRDTANAVIFAVHHNGLQLLIFMQFHIL